MLILAFESSAKAASVALMRNGVLLAQSTQISGLTHSTTLLPLADSMLKNCGLSIDDVDGFAVAHGPGSFTGIRIGISTVKGLAWASGKPCIGVSTLEALAWNCIGVGDYICPCMDARRNQVYNAIFKVIDGRPVRITEDRAISLEDLASELRDLKNVAVINGDGAELAYTYLHNIGIPCVLAEENNKWQSGWGVCKAADGKEFGTGAELLPVYLRLSQAERERQERLEKKVQE